MRKFKCELCAGFCELNISSDACLEDQPLAWCPGVKALAAKWEEIEVASQPTVSADVDDSGSLKCICDDELTWHGEFCPLYGRR